MVKTAIRPSYFEDIKNLSSLKTETDNPNQEELDKEEALANLCDHKGYLVLKEFIDDLIGDLDIMIVNLMEQGAAFDVIGQKTVVKELCKEMLIKVKNKAEDAREARDNRK